MKKAFALVLVFVLALSLAACGGGTAQPAASAPQSGSAPSAAPPPPAEAGSSGKIAVLRNMTSSDHTAQFFAGCTDEGTALGYTVDTFMSDGDDVKMQDLMEQALQQNYAIWIVSHANEGYQFDMVSRAVEKGVAVSAFDCGGERVPGVSYTSQNDLSLSQISLDALIEKAKENGASEPIKIIEINTLGAIVPFDSRHEVIKQYEEEGKLKVVQLISPSLSGDFYAESYNGISTTLSQFPKGEVDGIWTASSAFLDGTIDAIKDAGRDEIIVTAIDISDTEVQRLVNEPNYYCCAAVDPYVIGVVDVRLAVLRSQGVEVPDEVQLDAVGVFGSQLSADDTMKSLDQYFENFGSTDLYNTDEIKAMRG